ncbi:hypothetical protein [Tunturiibacter gelidoferens]|uniref:Uncharacterized protein n=1 Tax=Tunturiibacter lichenicola TaxID=2051959 RepID=A0A7Y9NLQ3_9BACT|nr:hypothetical protein [Edaphobacter lichenicola]NYF51633.1 hypothetical protein [Edaphobacter lichenicola]
MAHVAVAKVSQLRSLDERVVRLPHGSALQGIDPPISPGSLILLEEIPGIPEIESDTTKTGWSRRVYALRKGADLRCGYLDRNDNQYVLLAGAHGAGEAISVHQDELSQLSYIIGVAVPV